MNSNAIFEAPVIRIGRFSIVVERGVPPPLWIPTKPPLRRSSPASSEYFGARRIRWGLSEERRQVLLAALAGHGTEDALAFRDLLEFVTTCGPRIQEALALTTRDVVLTGPGPLMELPDVDGFCRISLPLSPAAAAILTRRTQALRVGIERRQLAPGEARLWPYGYTWADRRWNACRLIIGAGGERYATLEALRRSAAAHLHEDQGMPLEHVARYLRHRHVETTREYLRVTQRRHGSDR